MPFQSPTTNHKLFMGVATGTPENPPVAAGSDTFNQVTELAAIERGELAQPAGVYYTLDSAGPRSLGGQPAPVDWTGAVFHNRSITQHVNLESDARFTGGRVRNWRVDYSDGQSASFQGFVTNFKEGRAEATGDASPPKQATFTIRETTLAVLDDTP